MSYISTPIPTDISVLRPGDRTSKHQTRHCVPIVFITRREVFQDFDETGETNCNSKRGEVIALFPVLQKP